MKKISIVWGICVLLIFTGLTVIGFLYQNIRPYDELKETMIEYSKIYVDSIENFKVSKNKDFKIELSLLKENYQNEKFEVDNDTCDGYVKVTKELFGLKYKATLKCNKYPK